MIAIPDARWGERPMALIVLKPDYQDTKAEDIIAIAQQAYERGHLPKYGIPQDVKFITELPKTSVGKIDKKSSAINMRKGYLLRLFFSTLTG